MDKFVVRRPKGASVEQPSTSRKPQFKQTTIESLKVKVYSQRKKKKKKLVSDLKLIKSTVNVTCYPQSSVLFLCFK